MIVAARFSLALLVTFVSLTAAHEAILRRAGHVPAINDDESLWCLARDRVESLGADDIVLLGASRMQTDIHEPTLREALSGRRIVSLALSGHGTSLPVFEDLVRNTRFAGTAVIDETEQTLTSDGKQQLLVEAYARRHTFDRALNRHVETWLQTHLVCLAPGESFARLWPSLLVRRRATTRPTTVTNPERFSAADDNLTPPDLLAHIQRERLIGAAAPEAVPALVETAVARWQRLVTAFRDRGGRVVFVRLPVSTERWRLDNAGDAAILAWNQVMARMEVPSLLCNAEADCDCAGLTILDHSHLNVEDTPRFTAWLCRRVILIEQAAVVGHPH